MVQQQNEDAFSDPKFSFSDESADDSDGDPLFQLSVSDNESDGHKSLSVQLNVNNYSISSNGYHVTSNYQRYVIYENDRTLPIKLLKNNEPYKLLFLTDILSKIRSFLQHKEYS